MGNYELITARFLLKGERDALVAITTHKDELKPSMMAHGQQNY